MKRAIITGATGAIGTALINELVQKNIEVMVICREGSERNCRIPDNSLVKKVFCDLKDLENLRNDTDEVYDVFYHFAWSGTTGDGRNNMYLQNNNVRYSLDAVHVAKRFGCKVFIGAGSQAEYGRVEGILTPDTPTFPENGYGMAKLVSGMMTRELAHQIGLKHIWVRVLSVYGPNDNENSMVMSTVNKLKKNVIPQFTKGEQKWDYLYSADAARAFYLLGKKGIDGKTYVLGSGKVRALKEYIKDIRNVINPECEIELGAIDYAEKQVMHLEADITELINDVGFEPYIDFESGIKTMLAL